MNASYLTIQQIPAVLYGEPSDKIWLFIHGRQGCKEEGADFAKIVCCNGWQVLSIDMPEHGVRQGASEKLLPWQVVPELQTVMTYARQHWEQIALYAVSIGAWFSLMAFQTSPPVRSLFVSPVLDMEQLICQMMARAHITETDLEERGEIETDFGETLSWCYLQYTRAHPAAVWSSPTAILYAGRDYLTERRTVETFAARFHAQLTVMEEGEHWFHTEEQLNVLHQWTLEQVTGGIR